MIGEVKSVDEVEIIRRMTEGIYDIKTPDFKLSGQRRNFLYYPDRTQKAE